MERLSKADQTRTAILTDMQTRLAALGVDVKVNPDAGTLMLPSKNLFGSGQADPTVPDGRNTILRLGAVMSEVLPCYSPTGTPNTLVSTCPAKGDFSNLSAVYIEGHTDAFPYGNPTGRFRNDWDPVGRSRDRSLHAHPRPLRTDTRLKNQEGDAVLGVSGYADTRPADRSAPDRMLTSVADKDRRIEIRIIMSTNEQVVGAVLRELNQRLGDVDGLVR